MRASQLIKRLQDVVAVHGDLLIEHRELGHTFNPADVKLVIRTQDVIPKKGSEKFIEIIQDRETSFNNS